MRPLLLGLLVSLALPAAAQKVVPAGPLAATGPANCATGSAEAVLDAGDVRAALYNIGALFWRGSGAQYEVPVGSNLSPMFVTSLWVGGRAGGELRFAGSTYGPWEFWPGPLDADGETTPERCAAFDRIWTVTVQDVERYSRDSTAVPDLEGWPVAFGAPFYNDLDGDNVQDEGESTVSLDLGDPGYGTRQIDLEGGERPVIYGQQTAWWVMNDNGGPHDFSQAPALEVEVRVLAWTTGFGNALSQSTFYRYHVINRSDDVLDNVYAGVFVDADVGEFNDDYVHSDSTRQMLVFYNGDEFDDGGSGYGASPPALGIDVLSGGHAAMNIAGVGPTSEPDNAVESYRYLRGVWNDGTLLREGGDGYDSAGPVVTWAFPGDPATGAFWSMENTDGNGARITPSDKRGSVSAEPVALAPGERLTVDLGIVFALGASRLESVVDLRAVSDSAQVAYDSGRLFGRYNSGPVPPFPSVAPDLVSPEDGATFNGTAVTFEWTAVPNAERYTLQIDSTEAFLQPETLVITGQQTQLEVSLTSFPANYRGPLYWRVAGFGGGRRGPYSAAREFTNAYFQGTFTLFEVVANAAGPIVPATGGAADFAGFPVPQRPGEEQQTTNAVWFLAAGGGDGTFGSFFDRVIGSRDGNADQFDGSDYEVRFTGSSQSYRRFQDQALMEVPFEIWNIGRGTPDDPSDDYRMVPAVLDDPAEAENGGVGNGVFDLSTLDSPVSGAENDPETDWLFWYEPNDTSPGEAGYQAWLAGAATAPEDHGPEVMARTTFVGWNLGTAPPYPEPHPEPGTVFRLTTTKPFNVSADDAASRPALALEAFPNPASARLEIAFALGAAGQTRLVVYDVLGREVAVLEDGPRAAGGHRVGLGVGALSPGVYVVVLEGAGARASRTVTVVR